MRVDDAAHYVISLCLTRGAHCYVWCRGGFSYGRHGQFPRGHPPVPPTPNIMPEHLLIKWAQSAFYCPFLGSGRHPSGVGGLYWHIERMKYATLINLPCRFSAGAAGNRVEDLFLNPTGPIFEWTGSGLISIINTGSGRAPACTQACM